MKFIKYNISDRGYAIIIKCRHIAALLLIGLLEVGCATHTNITPLGKGNMKANLSFGGPIVKAFGTHIPIPYLTAGAGYGLREDVNINASLHLMPLAYSIAGLDVEATWFPRKQEGWKPTVGLGARYSSFVSIRGGVEDRFMSYPALSGSGAWHIGPGRLYTGTDLAILLTQLTYDEKADPMIFSPFFGYRWKLGTKFFLFTELKWQGANIRTDRVVTDYTNIGKLGALTTLVSVQWRF